MGEGGGRERGAGEGGVRGAGKREGETRGKQEAKRVVMCQSVGPPRLDSGLLTMAHRDSAESAAQICRQF